MIVGTLFLLPLVHNSLLGLCCIEQQVVVPTPHCQLVHPCPVDRLVPSRDEPHHHGVLSKFDDGVSVVGWVEVRGCRAGDSVHSLSASCMFICSMEIDTNALVCPNIPLDSAQNRLCCIYFPYQFTCFHQPCSLSVCWAAKGKITFCCRFSS